MKLTDYEATKIYETGQKLLPRCEYIFKKYHPKTERPDIVEELLEESVGLVIENLEKKKISLAESVNPTDQTEVIKDISGYLLKVFENKTRNFFRKKKEEQIDLQTVEVSDMRDSAFQIERKILINEIARLMEPEDRFIFEKRLLKYTFEEIAPKFNRLFKHKFEANSLRVKFSRAIKALAEQILANS